MKRATLMTLLSLLVFSCQKDPMEPSDITGATSVEINSGPLSKKIQTSSLVSLDSLVITEFWYGPTLWTPDHPVEVTVGVQVDSSEHIQAIQVFANTGHWTEVSKDSLALSIDSTVWIRLQTPSSLPSWEMDLKVLHGSVQIDTINSDTLKISALTDSVVFSVDEVKFTP